MKVCSACNEIVSAGQGCARPDCPNQSEAAADPACKVEPGSTGKADRAVQAGLDRADDAARKTSRKGVFVIFTLGVLILIFALAPWSKLYLAVFDFHLKEVEIIGVSEDKRTLEVYSLVLDHWDKSPDLDKLEREINNLIWVREASITVKPPSKISIDIDINDNAISNYIPKLKGIGAEKNVSGLRDIISADPQLAVKIESAEWIGDRRWDVIFATGQRLKLPEGNDTATKAFSSFSYENSDNKLLTSRATEFDMRVSGKMYIKTH
jgi:cell division protein FtsQ